jgi:hypothetical protein
MPALVPLPEVWRGRPGAPTARNTTDDHNHDPDHNARSGRRDRSVIVLAASSQMRGIREEASPGAGSSLVLVLLLLLLLVLSVVFGPG